jgi:tRNA threonylcarbamoyladenosine biosynthesis protein TsaB
MMRILAVDTSGKSVSAAIVSEGGVSARFWLEPQRTHAAALMPCVEAVLSGAGVDIGAIDVFAAVTGPGSFTGLRVGVSAVQGMAYACGARTVGVSTLDVLACALSGLCPDADGDIDADKDIGADGDADTAAPGGAGVSDSPRRIPEPAPTDGDRLLCPMIDARNDHVYTAVYRSAGGALTRLTPAAALSVADVAALLRPLIAQTPGVLLNGDAAPKYLTFLNGALNQTCVCARPRALLQDAVSAALIAHARVSACARAAVHPSRLQPVYLRLPQAERLRQNRPHG